jgi:RNA-binding protein YhbY
LRACVPNPSALGPRIKIHLLTASKYLPEPKDLHPPTAAPKPFTSDQLTYLTKLLTLLYMSNMTTKRELAVNATRWAEALKADIPQDIGYVLIMFDKGAIGQKSGVVIANVNREGVLAELKSVLAEHPLIHVPGVQ